MSEGIIREYGRDLVPEDTKITNRCSL